MFLYRQQKFSSTNDEVISESRNSLSVHLIISGTQCAWILFKGLRFISGGTHVTPGEVSSSHQHRQACTWHLASLVMCQATAQEEEGESKAWRQASPGEYVSSANKLSNKIKVQNIQPSI